MSSDESSELSSVPSDTESDLQFTKKDGLLKFFSKALPESISNEDDDEALPQRKREPSPAHEYILADNPDIAFIVMFRSRFSEAFPNSLINFGPQELEQDIVELVPGERVEIFLCAVLGLLLNRKQDVKPGHYNRALEEAIQSHKSQWAKDWGNKTPLSKGATFSSMLPEQRLTLLRTLILWALSSSDVIKGIIQSSYKQQRQEDDLNQPLSVQPWGSDSDKRIYYLIEGLYDTQFRVYRESSHMSLKRTWWSVASNIDELRALAEKLQTQDGGQKARVLSSKILVAIPRFEAAEEKRKRREYRATRKQLFKRVDSEYSSYEGRTRGKRIKYTFSDEDDCNSTNLSSSRRSRRNNGNQNSSELNVPTITQSGRQIRSRNVGTYCESISSNSCTPTVSTHPQVDDSDLKLNFGQPRKNTSLEKIEYSAEDESGTHLKKSKIYTEANSDYCNAMEHDYKVEEETLESDFNEVECSSVDDKNDDLESDAKNLIVKLPVHTSTQDHKISGGKTVIKLRLTPEKEVDGVVNGLDLRDKDAIKEVSGLNPEEDINLIPTPAEFTKTNIASESLSTEKNIFNPNSPLKC